MACNVVSAAGTPIQIPAAPLQVQLPANTFQMELEMAQVWRTHLPRGRPRGVPSSQLQPGTTPSWSICLGGDLISYHSAFHSKAMLLRAATSCATFSWVDVNIGLLLSFNAARPMPLVPDHPHTPGS